MNETFNLSVTYKGKEVTFSAKLLVYRYSYKIQVDVNSNEVLFEPDEERNYRATIDPEKVEGKKIDMELLTAIAGAIEAIVR
ncbi:hypothetical protein [Segetibacter koreensis]|uniref:hypothetical protein n=1 Tax=Segetibacter koreensis TaxID=398037 RepID=UPI000372D528|nr:hypothetical protein [Segetibacter koreensis]